MPIIHSNDIPESLRRDTIRDLADITSSTMDDDTLDEKIKSWDEVARTYFGVQQIDLSGTEPYFRNLVTVSNLLTSVAIRQGLGGSMNISVAKEQITQYMSIVSAQNRKAPEQGEAAIKKTSGINNMAGTFG